METNIVVFEVTVVTKTVRIAPKHGYSTQKVASMLQNKTALIEGAEIISVESRESIAKILEKHEPTVSQHLDVYTPPVPTPIW